MLDEFAAVEGGDLMAQGDAGLRESSDASGQGDDGEAAFCV